MIPMPSALLRIVSTSLTVKIFVICFVSVHVPLIALLLLVVAGGALSPASVLVVALLATLAGTGFCLALMWHLIRPLRRLATAVDRYRADGTPLALHSDRRDEVGVLTRAVAAMAADVDALLKRLRHQAVTDPLTGLGNRRWLDERIGEEQVRSTRFGERLSVILFDLDNFKDINDRFGHDVGDRVLSTVGTLVRGGLRQYDLAARIGGEEFCLILPQSGMSEAWRVAERLRRAFEAVAVDPLPAGRITASFGIYESAAEDRWQDMLSRADRALYEAKEAGRNRIAGPDGLEPPPQDPGAGGR